MIHFDVHLKITQHCNQLYSRKSFLKTVNQSRTTSGMPHKKATWFPPKMGVPEDPKLPTKQ